MDVMMMMMVGAGISLRRPRKCGFDVGHALI